MKESIFSSVFYGTLSIAGPRRKMMNIESIVVKNEGFVHCKSRFYSSQDGISQDDRYFFTAGVNKLYGEIDSGVWAVSYLLSMYKCKPKDFILFGKPEVIVNDKKMLLSEVAEYTCYMDESYYLFKGNRTVKKMVKNGIKKNKLNCSADEIRKLFYITPERFERPFSGVGNEIFKAMSAIAYAYNKQVYCFPWLSKSRFDYYHYNITGLLEILEKMNKTIILPIGE